MVSAWQICPLLDGLPLPVFVDKHYQARSLQVRFPPRNTGYLFRVWGVGFIVEGFCAPKGKLGRKSGREHFPLPVFVDKHYHAHSLKVREAQSGFGVWCLGKLIQVVSWETNRQTLPGPLSCGFLLEKRGKDSRKSGRKGLLGFYFHFHLRVKLIFALETPKKSRNWNHCLAK